MSIITGYQQYLRKYRIIVSGKKSGKAIDVSNLHCTFNCEKSVKGTPNYSQIEIYNLSEESINSIQVGDTVILEAGYKDGNYGMIFTGQIVQPFTTRDGGVDLILTLICQDGDKFLNSSFTAQTVSKGASKSDIIGACIKGSDVSTGALSGQIDGAKLPRGMTLFGKSSGYINRITSFVDCQFYVEDGAINIVAASDYDKNTAVELNPDTGLIGTPSQTDDGVSGQCLINPSIKLNTLIYINASLVQQKQVAQGKKKIPKLNANGVYRIIKLVYEGDTRGDSWYCNFEAITQSGKKPDGVTGDESNPWR